MGTGWLDLHFFSIFSSQFYISPDLNSFGYMEREMVVVVVVEVQVGACRDSCMLLPAWVGGGTGWENNMTWSWIGCLVSSFGELSFSLAPLLMYNFTIFYPCVALCRRQQ
jgi:hypothetical protein